jgi:hypothetical protein
VQWLGKPAIEVTWVSADKVPSAVIDEYEKGIQVEAETYTDSSYGQEKSILSINRVQNNANKKPRIERKVIEDSTG